jgi:hypothetical protein
VAALLAEYRQPGTERPQLAPVAVYFNLKWIITLQLKTQAAVCDRTAAHLAYLPGNFQELIGEDYHIDLPPEEPPTSQVLNPLARTRQRLPALRAY